MLSIGTMSGTSMDGIDIALIDTDGVKVHSEIGIISREYHPLYKIILKSAEYAVRQSSGNLGEASDHYISLLSSFLNSYTSIQLNDLSDYMASVGLTLSLDDIVTHSTDLHIFAVSQLLKQLNISSSEIDIIGYHGQTLCHMPQIKRSIIVGDGQKMASALGIKVITDFRANDVMAGGQGAPFAPIYHLALVARDHLQPAAVVNCGGIANITLIESDNPLSLVAFDTGPGNGLIDKFVRIKTDGKEVMDKNGQYGLRGKLDQRVFDKLYAYSIIQNNLNYFSKPYPKSLDINDMILIPELLDLSLQDGCATLEAFTAETIASSIPEYFCPKHFILAGGGWSNPVILSELQKRALQRKPNLVIKTANEIGWSNQGLEAQLFAFLAVRSVQALPLSYPNTTGVPMPMTGGRVYIPRG